MKNFSTPAALGNLWAIQSMMKRIKSYLILLGKEKSEDSSRSRTSDDWEPYQTRKGISVDSVARQNVCDFFVFKLRSIISMRPWLQQLQMGQ